LLTAPPCGLRYECPADELVRVHSACRGGYDRRGHPDRAVAGTPQAATRHL